MSRSDAGRRACLSLVAGCVLGTLLSLGGAQAQQTEAPLSGMDLALRWAATVDIVGPSGSVLRTVNGTVLREGVVVQTSALAGASLARVRTRSGETWESAAVLNTHPLLGLSLLQVPASPSTPVTFPEDRSYKARMRVLLLNGPGDGPDSLSARIYRNFQILDFPDLSPIDTPIAGAAPAVDNAGRFLGVACEYPAPPPGFGYIVPAVSVEALASHPATPRPLTGLRDPARPAFEDEHTAGGLLFRGAFLTHLGRYDEARHFLAQAEERDSSLTQIRFWRGQTWLGEEQHELAAVEFREAAARDSTDHQSWHMAGVALHQGADYEGAEAMYQRALQVKPEAADTYCNLGGVYLATERDAEAETAWRTSIRIDPRYMGGLAYYNLASMLKHAGRAAAVDSIYFELLRLEPSWAERLQDALNKSHH